MLPTLAEIAEAEQGIREFLATPAVVVAPVAPAVRPAVILPFVPVAAPVPAFNFTATGPNHGTLTITTKRYATRYELTEFRVDGGRGFRLEKLTNGSDRTADAYDVFLADEALTEAGIAYSSCDCKGFERHGHCKHVEAVQHVADRNGPARGKPAPTAEQALNQLTTLLFPSSVKCDRCRIHPGKTVCAACVRPARDTADLDRW